MHKPTHTDAIHPHSKSRTSAHVEHIHDGFEGSASEERGESAGEEAAEMAADSHHKTTYTPHASHPAHVAHKGLNVHHTGEYHG